MLRSKLVKTLIIDIKKIHHLFKVHVNLIFVHTLK